LSNKNLSKEELEMKMLQKATRPWYKKKRYWTIIAIFLLAIVSFTACTAALNDNIDELNKQTSSSNDSGDSSYEDVESEDETPEQISFLEEPKVIYDKNGVKATITSIYEENDSFLGKSSAIEMEVENNTSRKIEFNFTDISVGGVMMNDNGIYLDLAANKKGKDSVGFDESFEEVMPDFTQDVEATVEVIDSESYDTIDKQTITLKAK